MKPELAAFTKGYNFDCFYKFNSGEKLGVDVFTRLPLSEEAVRVFSGKIKDVGCTGYIYTLNNVPTKVAQLCKGCGIILKYIEKSNIPIAKIREDIEKDLLSFQI